MNPFVDWNFVFVHYCDGSAWVGDQVVNYENADIYMLGNKILYGVINELKTNYRLNNMTDIIFGGKFKIWSKIINLNTEGGSVGGLGVLYTIEKVRKLFSSNIRFTGLVGII